MDQHMQDEDTALLSRRRKSPRAKHLLEATAVSVSKTWNAMTLAVSKCCSLTWIAVIHQAVLQHENVDLSTMGLVSAGICSPQLAKGAKGTWA